MEKNLPLDRNPHHSTESTRIPVMEEELKIDVAQIPTGKVHAKKKVHEEELIVSGPVMHDELSIERISRNQYIDEAPPSVRYEGETMVISVIEEEVVVQTRIKLIEEVRITRRQVEKTVEQPVTVRREEVIVERKGAPEGETRRPA